MLITLKMVCPIRKNAPFLYSVFSGQDLLGLDGVVPTSAAHHLAAIHPGRVLVANPALGSWKTEIESLLVPSK